MKTILVFLAVIAIVSLVSIGFGYIFYNLFDQLTNDIDIDENDDLEKEIKNQLYK